MRSKVSKIGAEYLGMTHHHHLLPTTGSAAGIFSLIRCIHTEGKAQNPCVKTQIHVDALPDATSGRGKDVD